MRDAAELTHELFAFAMSNIIAVTPLSLHSCMLSVELGGEEHVASLPASCCCPLAHVPSDQ
jgi:hypothetical protein